jgi:hypothetical protein
MEIDREVAISYTTSRDVAGKTRPFGTKAVGATVKHMSGR